MPTLNLGILAHVDAGKTSLTERLLFDTGVIGRLGSVDAGDTQTDTNEIERRRGITIRTAVGSFTTGDLQVNLVDTPGHPDFIAEVERALAVLDGVVLVLSAVEGVQAQTRVLVRMLKRTRLPTLISGRRRRSRSTMMPCWPSWSAGRSPRRRGSARWWWRRPPPDPCIRWVSDRR